MVSVYASSVMRAFGGALLLDDIDIVVGETKNQIRVIGSRGPRQYKCSIPDVTRDYEVERDFTFSAGCVRNALRNFLATEETTCDIEVTAYGHLVFMYRDTRVDIPARCLTTNGVVETSEVAPAVSAAPAAWVAWCHSCVVVDHPRGTYKPYCDPHDPRDDSYPMKGITYPTDKGGLTGYTGEDGLPLDGFVGAKAHGENGMLVVYRPDTRGEKETKFFFGLNPDEKWRLFKTFESIMIGEPVIFTCPEEMIAAMAPFRDDKVGVTAATLGWGEI